MSYTPYVDFESVPTYEGHHIVRVGCMRCNDTIATKDLKTNNLYFWDHKRDVRVLLSDGSIAFVPVCSPCAAVVTDADLSLFEETIKYGWMVESVFQKSGPKAVEQFKDTLIQKDEEVNGEVRQVPIAVAAEVTDVKHTVPTQYMGLTILRRA